MICYLFLLTYASILTDHQTVGYSYSLPILFETFERIITDPNRSVSLKCETSGDSVSSISWKLDGIELKNNKKYRIGDFMVTDSVLKLNSYVNISSIGIEEGGVYECEAKNKYGSVKHSARVDVKGKPFIRPMSDINAIFGQKLIVNCPYSGFPIQSISWLKGSNRLPINKRQEVASNGSLIIQDVQKGVDDGIYTCSVTNGHQVVKKDITIFINVGPVIDPFKFPERIQKGMRARLVCTVIKGDPPFVFKWLKNNKTIESSLNNLAIRSEDFSSDLTFTKVSTLHNGNYTCVVSNSVASTSHSAALFVDVPPYWKVEPSDSSVVMGSNILIDCLAKGSPSPIISWEKGSSIAPRSFTIIPSGPHFEVYANGSLLIKMVDKDDAGVYLCQANNSIGPALSKMITLTVHAPPQFMTTFRSEKVKVSEDITLNCDARGDSPMQIQWYVDKKFIKPNKKFTIGNETWPERIISSLKIEAVTRKDSAIFTCLVSNVYGKDEMSIHLTVQEPPESPKFLKVIDHRSREAKLSWYQSFNGNSEINRFWITCHSKDYTSTEFSSFGHYNMSVDNLSTEDGPTFLVRDLRPATTYICEVKAENDVGLSESSNSVEFKTDEQAPEGPPLNVKAEAIDSRSIRVSWNPPERNLWNGQLKGYYIGYKIKDSGDQYLYKTLEVKDGQLYNEVVLTSLKPFTMYIIIVQVYNSMATGPRSDEVTITTFEDVPSKEPKSVTCKSISSQSLSISWEPPPLSFINGILLGYRIIYRPLGAEVKMSKENTTLNSSLILKKLLKFTNYSVEVVPFTQKGDGIPSRPIYCLTDQDVPGPPSLIKVLIASDDSAIVTWKDPKERNGFITQYAVYWQEVNKNNTKSSVTVPKNRNIIYYRWPESSPQYKITGLKEFVPFKVWVTAFTVKGEGVSTAVLTGIPTHQAPARILEWNETFLINGFEMIPFVLGCHTIGAQPIQRTWTKNDKESLISEADGSLLIQIIPQETSNFTCFVYNEYGSHHVTYQLNRESATGTDKNLHLKVILTSQTSAQISFFRESTTSPGTLKDYELNYRVVGWNVYEWQIKPIFRVLDGNNTVWLDNLLCGTQYKLFISDLQTGTKSETITFQTRGSAPVAPKKEDIIKLIGNSTIHIYPNSWDQSTGCPITKLIIEYRSSNHHTWKMVSNPTLPHNAEPIQIKNLVTKLLYSIRITAHTKGNPLTMAEYDVRLGIDEKDAYSLENGFQKGLVIDTTTMISFLSSLIVLIAGCFAITCLIAYKRNISNRDKSHSNPYRRQSSISCGPSPGNTDNSSDKRTFFQNDSSVGLSGKSQASYKIQSFVENSPVPLKIPFSKIQRRSKAENKCILSYGANSPIKGRLPAVRIPTKQLEEIEKDSQNEYDEITPYATFRLTGDDDPTAEEEFKTFSIRIVEPGYMHKLGSESAPTTSRDYKLSSSIKSRESYHLGMINSQSITSGSSNQEELLHAYEYGRRYQFQNQSIPAYYYEDDGDYSKSIISEMETPTDPGIREFTKTPPKPNEKRQAACFNPESDQSFKSESGSYNSLTAIESTSSSTTPVNEGKIINVLDKLSKEQTRNWLSKGHVLCHKKGSVESEFKTGLSSDEEELEIRDYYPNKSQYHKSKCHEKHSEVTLEAGQRSPRHRSKRPPIQIKS